MGAAAAWIDILETQQELAASRAGPLPRIEGGESVTQMQVARRAGREPCDNHPGQG